MSDCQTNVSFSPCSRTMCNAHASQANCAQTSRGFGSIESGALDNLAHPNSVKSFENYSSQTHVVIPNMAYPNMNGGFPSQRLPPSFTTPLPYAPQPNGSFLVSASLLSIALIPNWTSCRILLDIIRISGPLVKRILWSTRQPSLRVKMTRHPLSKLPQIRD